MKFRPFYHLGLSFMLLTACQSNHTPRLAEQPIHRVNPVPIPVLTQHHTDDIVDFQQLTGTWILKNVQLIHAQDKTDLLQQLDQKTFITLSNVSNEGTIGITASMGCNQMSITRKIDPQGKLSNLPQTHTISTLMGCGDVGERTENRFLKFLWESEQIRLHGQLLSLTDTQGNVLIFTTQQQNMP